jgi:glutathione S-transferase
VDRLKRRRGGRALDGTTIRPVGHVTTVGATVRRRSSACARDAQDVALRLIIGNKNYSSWSFRPWIAMKLAGIDFAEEVISLDAADFKSRVGGVSGTGKVPALVDGDVQVWESLAILEYLADRFPTAGLWPTDPAARAHARAIAAEMHAGFAPLRRHLPMNMWRPVKLRELTPEAAANVRRIEAIWADCRRRFGAGDPFLFGRFGAADAMYAPVVSRFHTYAVVVEPAARAYMNAVMALPAWHEWHHAAVREPWVLPEDEVDWPTVLRA